MKRKHHRWVSRREKRRDARIKADLRRYNFRRGFNGWMCDYRPSNRLDRKRERRAIVACERLESEARYAPVYVYARPRGRWTLEKWSGVDGVIIDHRD